MDKKDEESFKRFIEAFKPKIGKNTSFRSFMGKMKSTLNTVLKKKKRIKLGKRGKHTMLAAEWIDSELIDNINIRSRLSRNWRISRKNNESEEI